MVLLTSRGNPNINSFVQQNYFDATNAVNFKERGLRFAFGIEGYLDKTLKDDPRYVKLLVRTYRKTAEDDAEEKILPVHKCTLEDYD